MNTELVFTAISWFALAIFLSSLDCVACVRGQFYAGFLPEVGTVQISLSLVFNTKNISLHAQVQFHAKYSLFDSHSDREFTFSYAILIPNRTFLVRFGGISGEFGRAMVRILARRIYAFTVPKFSPKSGELTVIKSARRPIARVAREENNTSQQTAPKVMNES